MHTTDDFFVILKDTLMSFDFAAVIAAIISISASIYIFRSTPKYDLIYSRYVTLISPLFELMEPYLFKTVNDEILSKALNLIETNKTFAGRKLLHSFYFCKMNPSQDNYDALCSSVSKEYDRCCRRLGLGKRNIWYKIVRNQYKNKFVFILYMIGQSILALIILLSAIIFLFWLSHLFGEITGIEILPLIK